MGSYIQQTQPSLRIRSRLSQAGVHQVQGIAIAEDGSKAQTSERLVSVVDWEVRLLPNNVTMEVGEQRRFIPVVFNPRNGHQLPQRFQALQMGQFGHCVFDAICQNHPRAPRKMACSRRPLGKLWYDRYQQ